MSIVITPILQDRLVYIVVVAHRREHAVATM
eukprot:CAMPEP_0185598736 /NCGR_PEP_ID=MMETSP0434-20130131/82204_1 /TAXON_ID=626734 ORGANISM="Favella taraikaensis, Strain Fe Narragansett Bay" /NCGR_SAMPLE_ID=MMETSP0434 /ASSEMBLY_ACC=CAM_ASM_000379 /LENGTH=30 /DNA_ID= /DNA_START= /DNA_END= /DNA_ORIENTATION=